MDFKEQLRTYVKEFKDSGETLYRWEKGYGYPIELDPFDAEELLALLDAVDEEIMSNGDWKEFPKTAKARNELGGNPDD